MSRLPRVTGREVARALERVGFIEDRVRGSHHFFRHPDDPTPWVTVPVHRGHILPLGVLRNILRTARLSTEELREFLSAIQTAREMEKQIDW